MEKFSFEEVLLAISPERLASYGLRNPSDGDLTVYACYMWNCELSAALYPVLAGLEVSLRNSMHNAISKKFSTDDWFHLMIPKVHKQRTGKFVEGGHERLIGDYEITRQLVRLEPDHLEPLPPKTLVSRVTLGFWIGLFSKFYAVDQILWHPIIEDVFPTFVPTKLTFRTRSNTPSVSRLINQTRNDIEPILQQIKWLRDRISHHEPIWNIEDLSHIHTNILAIIGWINPSKLVLVKQFDRFPEVYSQGLEECKKRLTGLCSD